MNDFQNSITDRQTQHERNGETYDRNRAQDRFAVHIPPYSGPTDAEIWISELPDRIAESSRILNDAITQDPHSLHTRQLQHMHTSLLRDLEDAQSMIHHHEN